MKPSPAGVGMQKEGTAGQVGAAGFGLQESTSCSCGAVCKVQAAAGDRGDNSPFVPSISADCRVSELLHFQ